MDNADQQNFSSKLSADVEPFVPRQYHVPVALSHDSYTAPVYTSQVVHDIPSYITNCYPFVQEDYVRYGVSPDVNHWLGSNHYYQNIAVQPQQYASMQVPYSPVPQPCQYSQTYNAGSVKPKRSPQLRRRHHQSSCGDVDRKNWTPPSSGYDVHSVQSSLACMNLGNPAGSLKETRQRGTVGHTQQSRLGRTRSPTKPSQQLVQSSSVLKQEVNANICESTKNSSACEEGISKQPASKGGRVLQMQNSSSRYHNRTLGDFMLTLKSSKKGKTNSLPTKSDNNSNSVKQNPSPVKGSKTSLQGALPNGFEIRNSDWPTAGNMKANQKKEQRNYFFSTSITMPKPKSFADIIKSSPSKNASNDSAHPRENLSGWPTDSSRMGQHSDLNYFRSNINNNLSLPCYGMKSNSDKMFLRQDDHLQHLRKTDMSESLLIEHSLSVLDENLKIFDAFSSNSNTSKSKNRRNRTNDHSSNNAHAQVPCSSEVGSELELPKSYCRKTNQKHLKQDTSNRLFLVRDEANNNSAGLHRNSSFSSGQLDDMVAGSACSKNERILVREVLTSSVDQNDSGRQALKQLNAPSSKDKYSSNVDRNKNDCNSVNRNTESSRIDSSNYSSQNYQRQAKCQNCSSEQNANHSKRILRSTDGAWNTRNTSITETVTNDSEQHQKSKKKKKHKTPDKNSNNCLNSLQGKMVLLSPDMYSKLTSAADTSESKQTACYTSNKSEDYPELGSNAAALSIASKKHTAVEKCNIQDDDPDWSDIDSDYESSTGLFGINSAQELSNLSPMQCVNNGIQFTHTKASSAGLSYSAAVKKNSVQFNSTGSVINSASLLPINMQLTGREDVLSSNKPKRSKRSKGQCRLTASGEARNLKIDDKMKSSKQVSKKIKPKPHQPIALDFGQMIASAEGKIKKQRTLQRKHNKDTRTAKTHPVIANILDSSAPSRRRGKERETPTKKQPSALKKVILKEREERKRQRILEQEKRKRLLSGSSLSDNDGHNSQDSAWETQGSVSSTTPSDVDGDEDCENFSLPAIAKSVIHSRRFREYCNHVLKPEVDLVANQLLQDLIRFHNRLYHRDPLKAKSRRRIVLGLREVTKHLKLRKLKCLILAPNLDRIKSKGGLDDAIDTILALAREQNIPYVFALGRKALGKACLKQVPVSCVGIFNYSGSEKTFHHLMELVNEAQNEYIKKLQNIEKDLEPETTSHCENKPSSISPLESSSPLVNLSTESVLSMSSATMSLFASE